MFEDLFKRKKFVKDKLVPYGFIKDGEAYRYLTDIMNGEFQLEIVIDGHDRLETNGRL